MENSEIAKIFDEIADRLSLKDSNAFRIRSYRNAARTVRDHPHRFEDLVEHGKDLSILPNIGASTADKIHEILETGTCQRLEELQVELPPELTELMKVPQLGPRKVMLLNQALGVKSLEDLEKACKEGRVRTVKHMGRKTEEKILEGLAMIKKTAGRVLLQEANAQVEALGRYLKSCSAISKWEVAGSFRRRKETVGDLDVLIEATDRAKASEQIISYKAIDEVSSQGQEKITVRLGTGLQVDFRFFEASSFGAALHYFTGSKAHNIRVRRLAQERGWKLNEYGLFKEDHLLAGKTEESVFNRLDLSWIAPEIREDRGEIEAAMDNSLPRLVELSDIRGDLQCHTTASDGQNTIREMAAAAQQKGYEYLAITDHSKRVSMAKGLDDTRALDHAKKIWEVNEEMDGFWLLAGIEVDILKSGALDLREKTLADLDWVMASIHYDLNLSRRDMTVRLLSAIKSGVVHAIAHPLSRLIGKREPIHFDLEAVLSACSEHDVRMEINAYPERLDLPDTYCLQVLQAGVGFTIGTDAHKTADFELMSYGIDVARRGWLEKKHILNTLSASRLAQTVKRR